MLEVIRASNANSTISQYNISLNKWVSYAEQHKIKLWSPTVKNILEFLYVIYESGLGYSSINTAKSALSCVISDVDGFQVGKHPLIIKFMKGIAKLRPPVARYEVTWDADSVLSIIKLWPKTSLLSLKMLSLKLVSLLALVTAQRVQTLAAIEVKNIVWGDTVQIIITKPLKCTNINRSNVVLMLPKYTTDPDLCVVETLKCYIECTESMRKGESLFISYQKPFAAVTSQTISRWLCHVLSLAGIDTKKFHSHSFRHSATSKAAKSGVCIDSILKRVGWSHKSNTFARFYNRPIQGMDNFSESILKLKNRS